MRDKNGLLITPGRKVRRRDDGTFSVCTDDDFNDSMSPFGKNPRLNQKNGKGGNLNIKSKKGG